MRRRPEQIVQATLFQHFAARGAPNIFAFHPWAGGWRSKAEAKIMAGCGVRSGLPDILAISNGGIFGLELKVGNGRLSLAQRETHALLTAAGATVGTAMGLDEALEQLERWQLLRGWTQ
jgi:hypothetical protein